MALFRGSIASRRGRLDDDRLAFVDGGSVAPLQSLHLPTAPPYPVFAGLTGFASGKTKGPYAPVAGQDRVFHLLEKADGAADAAACMPLAAPARTDADMKVFEHHRIAKLQDLRIGQARIGHVRVHGVGAVEAR